MMTVSRSTLSRAIDFIGAVVAVGDVVAILEAAYALAVGAAPLEQTVTTFRFLSCCILFVIKAPYPVHRLPKSCRSSRMNCVSKKKKRRRIRRTCNEKILS